MTVGLVVVSHSAGIASGVCELASQMAPSITIAPAGGDDDGALGTSFTLIQEALERADTGDGVVVLYDLGSALLTTEMVVEMGDPDVVDTWRIVDAPLIEGTIAAAVEAEGQGDLDAVALAAQKTGGAAPEEEADGSPEGDTSEREVEIVNPLGLHARPAAALARMVSDVGTKVSVSVRGGPPVDLRAIMSVVGLATRRGDVVRLVASGVRAAQALDRVAGAIMDGFGESGADGSWATATRDASDERSAAGGSPGVAVGPLHRLESLPRTIPADQSSKPDDDRAELDKLSHAIDKAAKLLDAGNDIARAHAAMIRDPELLSMAHERVGQGAASAWWEAVNLHADAAAASPDEVIAARAVDVREAGLVVLRQLDVFLDRIGERVRDCVLLADEIGPGEVPKLLEHGCAGVVLRNGSPTAHAIVVARGLGLPVIVNVGSVLDDIKDGQIVIADGSTGTVEPAPTAEAIQTAEQNARTDAAATLELRAMASEPVTYQGKPVLVAANVGSLVEAHAAVENGADAIGLLRTELLLLERDSYPTEDEQVADLTAILHVVGDRPTVIRVLDAGGDKPVRSLDLDPLHNGFLGVRGLRYLLEHPDLLRTQLRAIFRASKGHQVAVMAPMVTVPDEARAFRTHVDEALESLRADDLEHDEPTGVGVMIEVPAAALTARAFGGIVDFVSVGSNDLLSYLAAADRTEAGTAHLLDTGSPALARLLDAVTEDSTAVGLPIAICGELAGDPTHTQALLDRGVHELSMAPARIPLVKKIIRDLG
ncbi:dihydroxyacetone kinase phosphoryl donor subunit DhaM [Demetria terragena]|uniref:dihydroxyacetone kinase phosphoryl donor subunit DhaM n=1 Tax=Demetria terragena TaxID=63959 RepID=UPI00039CFFB0|nr:dihydroxyacetone kinase phosphoryl donor subunit DhaM [Demetria terragena]